MAKLSNIPIRVERQHRTGADSVKLAAVLNQVRDALALHVASGQPGAIDLRQLPQMDEPTYRALQEALSTGEVTATVNTESKTEVQETQYPGVWWVTYRGEHGAIVTEIIEIAEIPAILKSHPTDIRNGLDRLQRTLAETARYFAATQD